MIVGRTLLVLSVLALLTAPSAATVPVTDLTVGWDLSATPGAYCALNTAQAADTSTNIVAGTTYNTTDAGGTVTIAAMTDAANRPKAFAFSFSMPVVCNSKFNVSVTSAKGGLYQVAGTKPTGGLTDNEDYLIDVSVGAGGARGQVNASGAKTANSLITNASAIAGTIKVSFSAKDGTTMLIPGNYSDTVTITVSPV